VTESRYERALAAVSDQLLAEFGNDLLGLLFAGSAAYGTPMKTSDLDLFVLIAQPWRQRRNLVVEAVEVELFINPLGQIRKELNRSYNSTIEMFARGKIVYDPQGLLEELASEARQIASKPILPPTDTYFVRYKPSDALKDTEDLMDVDPQAASLQLSVALREALEALFLREGRRPPKAKHLLQQVAEHMPDIAADARTVLDGSVPLSERVELLRSITERILAPVGGILLEGETAPEPVTD
jgi:predicted nucleotidyltransferase